MLQKYYQVNLIKVGQLISFQLAWFYTSSLSENFPLLTELVALTKITNIFNLIEVHNSGQTPIFKKDKFLYQMNSKIWFQPCFATTPTKDWLQVKFCTTHGWMETTTTLLKNKLPDILLKDKKGTNKRLKKSIRNTWENNKVKQLKTQIMCWKKILEFTDPKLVILSIMLLRRKWILTSKNVKVPQVSSVFQVLTLSKNSC